MQRGIGVAVAGFGWMGRAHTQAYQRVRHHYPDLAAPRLVAVADPVPGRAEAAAAQFGFERATTDWRELLDDPAVEAVSVTAPNFEHREIGTAVVAAGRHLWIEKPVGVTAADTRAVAAAAAGLVAAVGFNYRNVPAVRAARELIADGGIGTVTHASVRLLGDYAADADGAFTWRYELERAGHGVIGDLGSHGVDLIRYLLGEVAEVVADGAVVIPRRRRPDGVTTGHARAETGRLADVENEDWSAALLRMASGARVTLEVSRVATGHQNDYGFRIHGTGGAVEWDFRRMGELSVTRGDGVQDLPLATVFAGPGAGELAAFQPAPAIAMGYDDLKVIEAAGFLGAIAGGGAVTATLADAVAAATVLDAIAASAADRRWVEVTAR